jgi:hypothetical protein
MLAIFCTLVGALATSIRAEHKPHTVISLVEDINLADQDIKSLPYDDDIVTDEEKYEMVRFDNTSHPTVPKMRVENKNADYMLDLKGIHFLKHELNLIPHARKTRFTLATDVAANMHVGHIFKSKTSGNWLKVEGVDLLKRDIKTLTLIRNIKYCENECQKTRECESFSYTGHCWLKKSPKNYILKPDVDSYIQIPINYQCFANSDFYGGDFFDTDTSYNGCTKLCNILHKRCKGFTWVLNENKPLGQCYLKTFQNEHHVSPNDRGAITCRRCGAVDYPFPCTIS